LKTNSSIAHFDDSFLRMMTKPASNKKLQTENKSSKKNLYWSWNDQFELKIIQKCWSHFAFITKLVYSLINDQSLKKIFDKEFYIPNVWASENLFIIFYWQNFMGSFDFIIMSSFEIIWDFNNTCSKFKFKLLLKG